MASPEDQVRDLPGRAGLLENLSQLRRRFAQELTLEERLAGLTPEELLQVLTPQEKERLRAFLNRNS